MLEQALPGFNVLSGSQSAPAFRDCSRFSIRSHYAQRQTQLSNSQMQTSSHCFAAFLEYGYYEAHSLWGRLHGLIAGRKINFSLVYNVSQTGSGDLEVSYRLGRGCVAEWVSPSSCSVAEARLVCYVAPSLLGAHSSFFFFWCPHQFSCRPALLPQLPWLAQAPQAFLIPNFLLAGTPCDILGSSLQKDCRMKTLEGLLPEHRK